MLRACCPATCTDAAWWPTACRLLRRLVPRRRRRLQDARVRRDAEDWRARTELGFITGGGLRQDVDEGLLRESATPTATASSHLRRVGRANLKDDGRHDQQRHRGSGGRGDITKSHVAWKQTKGLPYVASGVAYMGQYVLIEGRRAGGRAYDPRSGKKIYSPETSSGGGSLLQPLRCSGERAHLAAHPSDDGTITVLKAGESETDRCASAIRSSRSAWPRRRPSRTMCSTFAPRGHLYAFAEGCFGVWSCVSEFVPWRPYPRRGCTPRSPGSMRASAPWGPLATPGLPRRGWIDRLLPVDPTPLG